jgi:hypothetical protein
VARALCVIVAACAIAGCARRARIEVTRIPGTNPPSAIVRCRAVGLTVARVSWSLGAMVRTLGVGPKDESALRVQWTPTASPAALGIACTVEDAAGQKLSAAASMAKLELTRATVAGGVVTVEGSGLGARVGSEDGVWLLSGGRALRADAACKGASWDDKKIVACAPLGVTGRAELRVASGGRLAALAVEAKP